MQILTFEEEGEGEGEEERWERLGPGDNAWSQNQHWFYVFPSSFLILCNSNPSSDTCIKARLTSLFPETAAWPGGKGEKGEKSL